MRMEKKNIPKLLIIFSFLMIVFIGCNNSVEPFNYERDTPAWLKVKIDSMSTNQLYHTSKVYRNTWHNSYTYYIFNPWSSCVYCELYYDNGDKIIFTDDEMIQDYMNNRKDEIIIWEWKD